MKGRGHHLLHYNGILPCLCFTICIYCAITVTGIIPLPSPRIILIHLIVIFTSVPWMLSVVSITLSVYSTIIRTAFMYRFSSTRIIVIPSGITLSSYSTINIHISSIITTTSLIVTETVTVRGRRTLSMTLLITMLINT